MHYTGPADEEEWKRAKKKAARSAELRPFGDLTQDLEDLLGEAAEEHDLQMGEILAWVKNYLDIHYPDCVECYEDGTRPEYYYGPRRD